MTTATQKTGFDQAERQKWAGRAAAYDAGFARLCAYTVPFALDAAEVSAHTRVLDVGTGTGAVAATALARGAHVTALDADEGMLELARHAAQGAHLCRGELPGLPFRDHAFDAVVGNFVLNHVGRPRATLAELRRITRPAGHAALTIWPAPPAPGQALLTQAVQAAGAAIPPHLAPLAAEEDFPRTEAGLTELLRAAGFTDVHCTTLQWNHETDHEEWWSAPAAGVATIGQIITSQTPEKIADIHRHYLQLSTEFTTPDGRLALPHAALLVCGRA